MSQSETVEFLASGRAFDSGGPVEVVETHGAYVFLSGDTALKLKRAVTYDYMDLGTVELRRKMIARELDLNRPAAPEIYRDMVPVTREAMGLALGGAGPVVDWVLRMWRFPAEDELVNVAERGGLDDALATAIGEAVAAYHRTAPVVVTAGRVLIADILAELGRVFGEFPGAEGTAGVDDWLATATRALDEAGPLLDARGAAGHVRRCHGDLHLRNIVLIDGRPVLYDALEFDETLGTCDVLYDVGFLIMDLCGRDLDRPACRVLDAWLRAVRGAEDDGLAGLPLLFSVRAAIRAMVLLQTDAARGRPGESAGRIGAYIDLASRALCPVRPRLVAVGGVSGTGKSVLARALAPGLGALPGAVLLSSDLERKAGRDIEEHLPPGEYAPERRVAVYAGMFERAARIVGAGHSAILDATFLDPGLRAAAEAVAGDAGVEFRGLWLEAPDECLARRVVAREGDASDADLAVLRAQLAADPGPIRWATVDASGDPAATLSAARAALAG